MQRPNAVYRVDGRKTAEIRKAKTPRLTQDNVATKLQLQGIDLDKGTVQRIEAGKRLLTRQELTALAEILKVEPEDLLLN